MASSDLFLWEDEECVEAPRAALPCHPGGEQISPQGAQALKALLEQQHREVLARHQELLRKFLYQEEVLRQVLRRQSSSEKCGASFTASQATSDVRVAAALEPGLNMSEASGICGTKSEPSPRSVKDPRKPPAIITEESAPTSSRNTAPAGVESARPRTPSSPADAVKAAARRTWGYFRPSVRSDAAPEDSAGTGKTPTGATRMTPPFKGARGKFFRTFSQMERSKRHGAELQHGNITRNKYAHRSEAHSFEESWLQWLVWHPGFDLFFAILVISNSVLIGVEVQLSLSGPSSLGMRVAQYVYTAFFIVELLLRVLAHGCGSFFCGEDWSWAWFDFFIVMSSTYEVVTDLVGAMEDESGISGATALRALRVVRVARVVKTLRVVRIFRFVFALRTLVTSILSTLKSLFWALVLLGLIMYIFAVLFTQAVNDHLVDPDSPSMEAKELMAAHNYYGSLFDTMLSLFMSICGGVSWEDVIAPLKVISVLWTIIYVFYIAFVYFAVLNVITAVFCESAIESAQNDHAVAVQTVMAHKEVHLRKIRALFEKLGGGDMGVITYANFEEGINSQAVREYFETIGLDVLDAWTLFNLLDLDAGGSISVEEFFNGCLRLRGNAKSIDLAKIMHDQSWLVRNHGRFQTHMELEVQQLKEQITKLIKMSSGLGIREAKV